MPNIQSSIIKLINNIPEHRTRGVIFALLMALGDFDRVEAVFNVLDKLGDEESNYPGTCQALAKAIAAEHERILQAKPPKTVMN